MSAESPESFAKPVCARRRPPAHPAAERFANTRSYSLQVLREGATKQTSKEYYYIDWRRAIDACKYRIHKIDEMVKKDAKPTAEKAELRCPRCKSQYTMMQALDHPDLDPGPDDSGFLCARCDFRLDEIDAGAQADDMDDTPAKFNKLFGPLLTLMEEIDKMKIPAVEATDAIDAKIELPRDKDIDPGTKHEVVDSIVSRPTAVKGLDTGPEKINIQIGSSAEQNEKQRAAEKARQEKIAMQNQLPSWHTQSTVIKDAAGNVSSVKQEANGTDTPTKSESSDAKNTTQNLDAVFAQIEAERRKKEEEEDDDDDDEDDEDDDEFEDVTVDTPNILPDAKRMRLDSSTAPTPSNAATPAVSNGDGGDESEEDEFEDVN